MGTPTRTNTFNYADNYRQVISIAGRSDMDFMYPEMQQELYFATWDMNNNVFQPGAILSGLTLNTTLSGVITINSGSVYLFGRQENVPAATLNYGSTVANNPIYAQWSLNHITAVQDDTLLDPNTGNLIFEELQTETILSSGSGLTSNNFASPDAIDEDFEVFQSGVPYNKRLAAPWVLGSGTIAQSTPAAFSRYTLELNYTNGTATYLTSPTLAVLPSTTYYLYFWTKTVYGDTDLQGSDGAYVQVNITTPYKQIFATTGGATLLGGYTQTSSSFTTGVSDTSATITIEIPSTASPTSTSILFDSLLLTTLPLPAICVQRHFTQIMSWNRPTTPLVLTPTISPISALYLDDFKGNLSATNVIVTNDIYTPTVTTPTSGGLSDIVGPNLEEAIDQLANQRALLGGSITQPFNVGPATLATQAPEIVQIQNNIFTFCGADTTSGVTPNVYTVTTNPTITTPTEGALFSFVAVAANTSGANLVLNGTSYVLVRPDSNTLNPGDIQSGQPVYVTLFPELLTKKAELCNIPPAYYQQQSGQQNYAVDSGITNAYAITLTPTPASIIAGFPVRVLIANTNTGASTLAINSGTPTPIVRPNKNSVLQGDLLTGQVAEMIFDGANWQLAGMPAGLLALAQTSGGIGQTRGHTFAASTSLSTTPTTIITIPLIMPSSGAPFFYVDLSLHSLTQMLTNPNSTGAIVDVTWYISDSLSVLDTHILGVVSATADRNNTLKKKHFNDRFMSPTYAPNTSVTFTLQAQYAVGGTGSEGVAPSIIGGTGGPTWLQWIIHSANSASTDGF